MTELIPYLESLENHVSTLPLMRIYHWYSFILEVADPVSYTLSYDLSFTDLFTEGKLLGARTLLLFSTVQAKLFRAEYTSGTLQQTETKKTYQVTLAN